MKTKTKSKNYWDHFSAKAQKARPKHKAAQKPARNATHSVASGPQPKAKTMTAEAEETEETTAPQEEFLPPPDPPVVESPPTEPPAPDAVDESEKGADPEAAATRELNIVVEGTPGEGPKPEPTPEAEPQ